MKNISNLLLLGIVILFSSCSGCNRVSPNFKGVLMENCGRNGKDDFKEVTGSQGLLGPCTELYQVPLYEQSADPEPLYITSKDAGSFSVDPSYTYQPIPGKAVDIIFNYKHVLSDSGASLMDNIEVGILNKLVTDTYREIARNYSTDSLMNNMNMFENSVQDSLNARFNRKYFDLKTLTSGLKPPQSMIDAINSRNVSKEKTKQVENELETARMLLEKARIEAEANKLRGSGLTANVLQEQWIEAIRTTQNKVIITDGKTPVLLNQ